MSTPAPISDQQYASAWDLWWNTLPVDLRRKLSFDDFRRLGGTFFAAFEDYRKGAVEKERDECAELAARHRAPEPRRGLNLSESSRLDIAAEARGETIAAEEIARKIRGRGDDTGSEAMGSEVRG